MDEAGDPWRKPKRGRRLVHSPRKMVVICVLPVILGLSYRNTESFLHMLKLPWPWEPVSNHSTIHEASKNTRKAYFNRLLEKSAGLCIAAAGWVRGIVAANSAGVETDRYEAVELKMKKVKRRISIKYHVTAILDYNIIPAAK